MLVNRPYNLDDKIYPTCFFILPLIFAREYNVAEKKTFYKCRRAANCWNCGRFFFQDAFVGACKRGVVELRDFTFEMCD